MTKLIKCVIWDLDGTLWDGTLLEGDEIRLKPEFPAILDELNRRGIINTIASRNDEQPTLALLERLQIADRFIAPQINRESKPESVQRIAEIFNLGLDALAFIDDSPFEREAVRFALPAVMVIESGRVDEILDMPAFQPPILTEEARQRVQFYQIEADRKQAEHDFAGSRLDFLKSCAIQLTLYNAALEDIPRLIELAKRTNQINTSGISYSAADLTLLLETPTARVIVAELRDRFGEYGKIGAMVLRMQADAYVIESLMVSCRTDGRGIPSALLIFALHMARQAHVARLVAHYRRTERNRPLGILYQMMGFKRSDDQDASGMTAWVYDQAAQGIPEMPSWLSLDVPHDVDLQSTNLR